ncbi:MAG: NUDIX domain-containing protein [Phycisphaerales bacterium]
MSEPAPGSETGHRPIPPGGCGPRVRTDIVDVYIFRRAAEPGLARDAAPIEFLQLLRATDPLAQTWQPIMGHVEPADPPETAVQTALRELREEVGLVIPSPHCLGLWALEQVHPFYIAAIDTIVMSPRFACEVTADWLPTLNDEHLEWRWVREAIAFMWPGQRRCLEEIIEHIAPANSLSSERLRVMRPGPSCH